MSDIAGIRVGSWFVGRFSIIARNVRGEGGPYGPQLALSLKVVMEQAPREKMVAITRLQIALHGGTPSGGVQPLLGQRVDLPFLNQFRYRTLPSGSSEDQLEIRIPFLPAQVLALEAWRHEDPEAQFRGFLRFQAEVAWLRETWNETPSRSPAPSAHPFAPTDGMVTELAYFWTTSIEDLDLVIPASTWIDRVLPGLGIDQLHLIEVQLPEANALVPASAIVAFGQARRQYELGFYPQCVALCRDVRSFVEQHLGATQANPVGAVVEQRLGWAAGKSQRQLLQRQYDTLNYITNVAHHVTGGQLLNAADARAALLLTATWIEYLGALR